MKGIGAMDNFWLGAALILSPFVLWGGLALVVRWAAARLFGKKIEFFFAGAIVLGAVMILNIFVVIGYRAMSAMNEHSLDCAGSLDTDAPMRVSYNRLTKTSTISGEGFKYTGAATEIPQGYRLELAGKTPEAAPILIEVVEGTYSHATVPGFPPEGQCRRR